MKRASVILLIFVLMSISFAGIGFLILYVSGTVTSLDDAKRLLAEEPAQIQERMADGVDLLEKQKSEVAEDLARTRRTVAALKEISEGLERASESGSNLELLSPDLERISGLLAGMDDGTAAATLAALDTDLAIKFLKHMNNQRASAILNEIEDAPTRTKLFNAMAGK